MPTPEGRAPRTQGQASADPEGAPGLKDHRSLAWLEATGSGPDRTEPGRVSNSEERPPERYQVESHRV